MENLSNIDIEYLLNESNKKIENLELLIQKNQEAIELYKKRIFDLSDTILKYNETLKDEQITNSKLNDLYNMVEKKYFENVLSIDVEFSLLLEAINLIFHIPKELLLSKNKTYTMVCIRRCLIKILRDDFKLPYEKCGELINRDHSSVINLYRQYNFETKKDEKIINDILDKYRELKIDKHVEELRAYNEQNN